LRTGGGKINKTRTGCSSLGITDRVGKGNPREKGLQEEKWLGEIGVRRAPATESTKEEVPAGGVI